LAAQLPRPGPLRAPRKRFAAFEVEALDAVVAGVGDVHVGPGHGDAAARGLGVVLRGAEVEAAERAAAVSPLRDERAVRVELLDPVVAGVDDVDVAGGVRREPADRAELPVPAAEGAPLGLEHARVRELLHDVPELVGDVHVALRVQRDRLGEAQHALRALADDLRGRIRARRRADARTFLGERSPGQRRAYRARARDHEHHGETAQLHGETAQPRSEPGQPRRGDLRRGERNRARRALDRGAVGRRGAPAARRSHRR